jgi:nucleoside-diphosphate-sugar epimerase
MKILVTGSDGYIGAQLVPLLLGRGHHVVPVDTGYYNDGLLYETGNAGPPRIRRDIRSLNEGDLSGCEAVVHMAELSNDPLGQHNPDVTYQINHLGSVALARACIRAGVSRFVYTSSCSVYGKGDGGGYKTEDSPADPQTAYACCKVLVERDVSAMASDVFSPTFLRNATAYGPSPRMRFDLVLNNLAGLAWTTREIRMTSDGTPWRPLVHVTDIARAIACTLEAPRELVHGRIFNVGSTAENYQVREIAQIVSDQFSGCRLIMGSSDGDNRSYRVNFDRIHSDLTGFQCLYSAKTGARELRGLFERIGLSDEMFRFRAFTRLKQLEHLIRTGQVDQNLYWMSPTNESADQDSVPHMRVRIARTPGKV